jgi:hypothetical protein
MEVWNRKGNVQESCHCEAELQGVADTPRRRRTTPVGSQYRVRSMVGRYGRAACVETSRLPTHRRDAATEFLLKLNSK